MQLTRYSLLPGLAKEDYNTCYDYVNNDSVRTESTKWSSRIIRSNICIAFMCGGNGWIYDTDVGGPEPG